jgi:translation elongation factor P/translation initiation factor 5A
MTLDSIKEMLKTVHYYNTVNITQTFSRDDGASITARCLKDTKILEVTFPEGQKVEQFTCTEKAAAAIYQALTASSMSTSS